MCSFWVSFISSSCCFCCIRCWFHMRWPGRGSGADCVRFNVCLKHTASLRHSVCFSHSVLLLRSLHWLPVRNCINFKICTITYQALSSKQPACLHLLLSVINPARHSRHLILVYFLFQVLRQMSELELFQLLHRLCGTHSLLPLSRHEI